MKENMLEAIDKYVNSEIRELSKEQKRTLRALIYSGYKGEREAVLTGLLNKYSLDKVHVSSLIESFNSTFEGESVIYWRIKPEFFRAVRKELI